MALEQKLRLAEEQVRLAKEQAESEAAARAEAHSSRKELEEELARTKKAADEAKKKAEEEAKKKEEEAEARAKEKAAADAKVGIRILLKFVCAFSKSTLCFLCLRGMETIDFETILNFWPVSPSKGQTPCLGFANLVLPTKEASVHHVRNCNTLQET